MCAMREYECAYEEGRRENNPGRTERGVRDEGVNKSRRVYCDILVYVYA